jgi:hypothetical protein
VGQYWSILSTPGAEAFRRDNPSAEVRFYKTLCSGTHYPEIARAIRDFLDRKLTAQVRTAWGSGGSRSWSHSENTTKE